MRKTLLISLLMLAPLAATALQPAVAAESATAPSHMAGRATEGSRASVSARGPRLDPIGEAQAAQTVTLAVENMSCAACPITVRKALEKVPGVAKVKVDFDTKTATVTFDPAKTKVETLTRATTEAGYPSKPSR